MTKQAEKSARVHKEKWALWREYLAGHSQQKMCRYCGLRIIAIDPNCQHVAEMSVRWFHYDPQERPMGKPDPVYDLTRRCVTALEHRYLPELHFLRTDLHDESVTQMQFMLRDRDAVATPIF